MRRPASSSRVAQRSGGNSGWPAIRRHRRLANCCGSVPGELERFADAFVHEDPTGAYLGPKSQYWLSITGGRVVKIEEQYLP